MYIKHENKQVVIAIEKALHNKLGENKGYIAEAWATPRQAADGDWWISIKKIGDIIDSLPPGLVKSGMIVDKI